MNIHSENKPDIKNADLDSQDVKAYNDWLNQFSVWDEDGEIGDVSLCPNCKSIDIMPGQRVCHGCNAEAIADFFS